MHDIDRFTTDACDAAWASFYFDNNTGQMLCTCLICARCDRHTGNGHQGHYWGWCRVTNKMEDLHFCCPGDCELNG